MFSKQRGNGGLLKVMGDSGARRKKSGWGAMSDANKQEQPMWGKPRNPKATNPRPRLKEKRKKGKSTKKESR